MRGLHIDKQSAVDAALMIIGSAVGAAASAAFLFHRWAQKEFKGDAPATTTGEKP